MIQGYDDFDDDDDDDDDADDDDDDNDDGGDGEGDHATCVLQPIKSVQRNSSPKAQ